MAYPRRIKKRSRYDKVVTQGGFKKGANMLR
jgi:hypothetical protein